MIVGLTSIYRNDSISMNLQIVKARCLELVTEMAKCGLVKESEIESLVEKYYKFITDHNDESSLIGTHELLNINDR